MEGSNRETSNYSCTQCGSTVSHTAGSTAMSVKTKETPLGLIQLRDRSKSTDPVPATVDAAPTNVKRCVEQIRNGMSKRALVSFVYPDSHDNGAAKTRTVEPYKLASHKGEIVLYGFDIEANSIRMFKLDKMKLVEEQTFTFKERWPIVDKLASKNHVE